MIETSSGHPRKSSAIFVYLWEFRGMLDKVCVPFGQVLENLESCNILYLSDTTGEDTK